MEGIARADLLLGIGDFKLAAHELATRHLLHPKLAERKREGEREENAGGYSVSAHA